MGGGVDGGGGGGGGVVTFVHKNDLNEEICLLCAHNIFQIKSKKKLMALIKATKYSLK